MIATNPRKLELLRAAKVFYRYELAIRDALFLAGRNPELTAYETGLVLAAFRQAKPVAEAILAITLSRDTSSFPER